MPRIADLKRITKARIDAFLDTVERPEHVLPQLEKEMARKVAEAANAEAKALAATRGAQRRIDEAAGRALRLENGVKQAINAGDMDTARQAVAALLDAERDSEHLRTALNVAQSAYLDANTVRKHLQHTLDDLKTRKNRILTRLRAAKTLQNTLKNHPEHPGSGQKDILDTVMRMETRLEHDEIAIQAHNDTLKTLEFALETTKSTQNAEVDRRLAQLKAKYAPPTAQKQE